MKRLILLLILLFGNICFGETYCSYYIKDLDHNYSKFDPNFIYWSNFSNNSMSLEYSSGIRYINDLGHEFSNPSFILGTYYDGGVWGSMNGIPEYYGNTYWHYMPYPHAIPERQCIPSPPAIVILGFGFLVVILMRQKDGYKSR